MQNDMLKNTIAPWQEKGRWYHCSLTSDGTTWKINTDCSDKIFINAYVSSNVYLYTPEFTNTAQLIDVKFIYSDQDIQSAFNSPATYRYNLIATDMTGIIIPNVTQYKGNLDIWIFASIK